MDVRNCKGCGRLYNYIGGSYKNLCPDCIRKIEDKFEIVKKYIEDNKHASISQISEECDVTTRQIEQWIREERLSFTADSDIGIACEMCGKMIKSGRYCEECKSKLANQFGNMYQNKNSAQQQSRSSRESDARMRFLDN